MPLTLRIESELDERSATAAASRAERIYTESAQKMSRELSEGLTKGAREGGQAIERFANQARDSYKRVGDATDELRQQERQLKEMRDEGARGVEVQAERVRQARRREKDAIKEAAAAYDEYEQAARNAGQAGEQAGGSILSGLRTATAGAGQSGGDMANEFVGGFAGSSALLRLGASGGPIGLALAGAAALGVTAGKVLADNIAAGLTSLQTRDLFGARLGVDEATMARYGDAAGSAYGDAWGASVEDNLRTVQFSIQGGVIGRDASNAEIEQTIGQMQALASMMEVDVAEAARAAGQLIRGGFAQSGTEAADIIASGFQRGLDISGDWLDTITEYTTQFRKLGIDGNEALGLIQQGLEGGARDSDKVADSLKEFSIRAVDGSKLTAEGFGAIGFSADEMAQKFLAGGDSARSAFGATLQAIRSLEDTQQQALAWTALFGTQWEDMGDAINSMDLSTARGEFASTEGAIDSATGRLSEHVNQWDVLGRHIDLTFGKLQKWLADSAIGRFYNEGLPGLVNSTIFPDPAGDAQSQLDAAVAAERERRVREGQTGSGFASAGDAQRGRRGLPPLNGGPTPGERTPILTDTQQEALDAATGGSTSLPDAPQLPLQYNSTAGMPTAIANAQTRLDEARHAAAEKQARVDQLVQSNLATEEDIQKARNDLTKAERDTQQAEQALHDSKMSALEKQTADMGQMSNAMDEVGAALDKDLGISDGLAGIADNLVRFVASLAMAPMVGQLSAIAGANPNEGSGMMGMLAAQGAFGQEYTPAAIAAASGGGTTSASTVGAFTSSQGAYPAAVIPGMPTGAVPKSSFSDGGLKPNAARLNDIIAAQFPQIQDIGGYRANDPYPDHPSGRALDIMIPGYNTPQGRALGDQINQFLHSNAAALGLDSTIWQQQYQRAGGEPSLMGDRGSPTQNHMDHIHALTSAGASPAAAATPGVTPTWGGPQGIPAGVSGGGGQSPVFGATPGIPIGSGAGARMPGVSPGVGNMAGAPSFATGGQSYPSQGGGGGIGAGGMAMDAAMLATSGLDMMAPGAGAAAKIGIQVANRTAKYMGQNAGILVGGFLDTITPAGDNPKASIGNSWFGKIAGGIAGAAPALPNMSGGKKPPGPMEGGAGAAAGQGGNTINQTLNQTNNRVTEDFAGGSAVREMGAMHGQPGQQ